MAPPAVLSVDVERFSDIRACRNRALSTDRPDVALDGLEWLVDRLAETGTAATFFVVSGFATDHPRTIEHLAEQGHEIASHTHTHPHLPELSPEERRSELRRSKELLEAVSATSVSGFRAPSFALPPDHFMALHEVGYRYDSSVVPCRRIPGWYGGEYDEREPCSASDLDEDGPPDLTAVPVSVMPGLRLPLSGAWLRFFGIRYTLLGMKLLARRGIVPVLYIHPWELIDPPEIDGVPRRVYWRTGEYMRRAIDRLLRAQFEFVTMGELLETRYGVSLP